MFHDVTNSVWPQQMPHNGFAAQRRSPLKGFRTGYQRSAHSRTSRLLGVSRDEAAEVGPTPA